MRNMCDVDILIHQEEIDKIAPIMEKNGFSFEKDSPHEFIFVSGVVTVELHKSLYRIIIRTCIVIMVMVGGLQSLKTDLSIDMNCLLKISMCII